MLDIKDFYCYSEGDKDIFISLFKNGYVTTNKEKNFILKYCNIPNKEETYINIGSKKYYEVTCSFVIEDKNLLIEIKFLALYESKELINYFDVSDPIIYILGNTIDGLEKSKIRFFYLSDFEKIEINYNEFVNLGGL